MIHNDIALITVVGEPDNPEAAMVDFALLGLESKGPIMEVATIDGDALYIQPFISLVELPDCYLLLEDVDDDDTAVAALHGTRCAQSLFINEELMKLVGGEQGMDEDFAGVMPDCEQATGKGFIAKDVNLLRPDVVGLKEEDDDE